MQRPTGVLRLCFPEARTEMRPVQVPAHLPLGMAAWTKSCGAGNGADFLEVDVCWVTFEFNGLTCGNGGHVLQGVRDERFHEQWDH